MNGKQVLLTGGTGGLGLGVLPSVIDTPANREAMGAENAEKWVKAAKDIRGKAIPVYGSI